VGRDIHEETGETGENDVMWSKVAGWGLALAVGALLWFLIIVLTMEALS
jgi:hypothetical protein